MKNELRIITDIVCDHFNKDPDLILSKRQERDITDVRQVCHYFARSIKNDYDKPKYSLSTIAYDIGMKNHATALHSERAVKDRMEIYKWFNDDIERLSKKIDENLIKDFYDVEKDGYIIRYYKFRGFLKK